MSRFCWAGSVVFVGPFFMRRWQGQVGWRPLFWLDLLLVGTLLNAVATLAALALLSQGVPAAWALAVHLLPLPYGLFILAALWRAPGCPTQVRGLSLGWLALPVLI